MVCEFWCFHSCVYRKMGKTKGKKSRARQNGPTGVPSISYLESEEFAVDGNFSVNIIDSILEKLSSTNSQDKECGACTIANMADQPDFVEALLKCDVVRIIAPLLLDPNFAVRHAVAGALRNLSVCGGHDVSQAMVAQDVMTALVSLFKLYKTEWKPVKEEQKIDSKAEIFLEACNLLWNLCESSNTAVSIFNENSIMTVLLPCLNIEKFGLQISLAVAQCVHIVVEDNPEVSCILSQDSVMQQLLALASLEPKDPAHVLMRILCTGIVLSIHSGKIEECPSTIPSALLQVIDHTFSIPYTADLESLSEGICNLKAEKKNKYREADGLLQKTAAVDEMLTSLDHTLSAKQVALEILTNICFGSDDNDDWDDISSSDNGDEMSMDTEDMTLSAVKLSLNVPCEVHGFIVNQHLLDKVLSQIHIPSKEVAQQVQEISQGKNCLKRLQSVRCRALLCASNIVQGLDTDDLGGTSKLFDLWMNLADLAFKQTDISDNEQLEAATSCMRAVLAKIGEANSVAHFQQMTDSDLKLMTDIYLRTQDPSIKVNIIRIIATIGCLLGNSENFSSPKLIMVIGTFLIECCMKNAELWVTAEALDAIFDVFAEDHLDRIAQEISLVEKLTHLLPHLKGKIKQQQKSLGEHKLVVLTAKSNLIRFIKYKNGMTKNKRS